MKKKRKDKTQNEVRSQVEASQPIRTFPFALFNNYRFGRVERSIKLDREKKERREKTWN